MRLTLTSFISDDFQPLSLSLSSLSFFLPLHPHVHAPLSKRREADFAHVQRRPPTGADTMRTGIYATTRANIKANLFRTRTREGGGDERVYPLARCRIPFLFFSLSLFLFGRCTANPQHGSEIYKR